MATKNKVKKEETILIIVGSLLLIISFILFHYEKILSISDAIYNNIQAEIYKENVKDEDNLEVNINTNYIDKKDDDNSPTSNSGSPNYIGFIEIDKINLRQGFLSKNSYYNHIDYHVQILKVSDLPDVIGGNLILAAHSGNSYISYFHNLYKLNLGDIAKIYYNGKIYRYEIVNIYKEKKDGSVNIYRDLEKTCLTLITCTRNDSKTQTIYILELIGVETY